MTKIEAKAVAAKEKDFQTQANKYAHSAIANIREIVEALEHSQGVTVCAGKDKCKAGKKSDRPDAYHDEEQARRWLDEDPLSVQVRSGWYTPGDSAAQAPAEYEILLTTGGPAARIIGELDQYCQPENAEFQFQDWFKPWTTADITNEEEQTILKYAQHFWFGE